MSILPQAGNKINEFGCYEAKIEESEKGQQLVNPAQMEF